MIDHSLPNIEGPWRTIASAISADGASPASASFGEAAVGHGEFAGLKRLHRERLPAHLLGPAELHCVRLA